MFKYCIHAITVLMMAALLAGCTNLQQQLVAVEATQTDTPLSTTSTPRPTSTVTDTPSPTLTPTLTITPTSTNTPTPTPLPIAGPATGDGMTRLGKGRVNGLAFSPDGKLLSVATSIGVYLYQLESMELLSFIPGNANVFDTVFLDDKTLVIGEGDGTTAVWDIRDKPKVLETLQRSDPVTSLGVSDDGSVLIVELGWESSGRSASSFTRVVKWDRANPEEVHKVSSEIGSWGKFSPSGKFLFINGATPKTILIDTKRMRATATICFDCWSFAFLQDGDILATSKVGGNKSSIVLYDTTSHQELTSFQTPGYPRAFSPDERLVALTESDALHLWDVTAAELVNTFEGGSDLVSFSPDNKILASVSREGILVLREVPTGNIRMVVEGYSPFINVVFTSDYFSSTGNSRDKILLHDINTGEIIRSFSITEGSSVNRLSIIFSGDGTTIASTWRKWRNPNYIDSVELFDVLTSEYLTSMNINGVVLLAFSSDGSLLAYSTRKTYAWQDAPLKIWDINAGEPLKLNLGSVPSKNYDPYMKSLVFSPEGSTIAVISDSIILRDILTGERITTLKSGLDSHIDFRGFEPSRGEGPTGVFSPDGKILATTWLMRTSDGPLSHPKGVIILWDVTNGEKIAILDGHADPTWDEFGNNPITALAISPDGTLLASGAEDKTIVIWSVGERSLSKVLEGHSAGINSLSFSPDGKYLYSGSSDGTVITWDLEQLLP